MSGAETLKPPAADAAREPFVGPRPFREGEKLYGRKAETNALSRLLISERVAVLHSPSGAGKSSLINAELVPLMRRSFFVVPLPVGRPAAAAPAEPTARLAQIGELVDTIRHRNDLPEPVPLYKASTTTARIIENWNARAGAARIAPESLEAPSLSAFVHAIVGKTDARPFIILDQFEDVFAASAEDPDELERFFTELRELLHDSGIWALISMREDYLGRLEPWREYFPSNLRARFRLDLLMPDKAAEAITEPVKGFGVRFSSDAVQQLVDELRRYTSSLSGRTTLAPSIEPVLLQVVCREVWRKKGGALEIAARDIPSGTEINDALANFYRDVVSRVAHDTQIDEAPIRRWCGSELIKEHGRAQTRVGPTRTPADVEIVRRLEDAHLIRSDTRAATTWYELVHDRMVDPILADNTRWEVELPDEQSLLRRSADKWAQGNKSDVHLLRGGALAIADTWARAHATALTPLEREFLNRSRAERNLVTRRKIVTAVAALAIAAAVYAAFRARREAASATTFAIAARSDAEKTRAEAESTRQQAEAYKHDADREIARQVQWATAEIEKIKGLSEKEKRDAKKRADAAIRVADENARRTEQAARTRAEDARRIADADIEAARNASNADVTRAQSQVAALSTIAGAQDLATNAKLNGTIGPALTAMGNLVSARDAATSAKNFNEVFASVVTAADQTFSDLLRIESHQPEGMLRGLTVDAATGCASYISDRNRVARVSRGAPCAPAPRFSDAARGWTSAAISPDGSLAAVGDRAGYVAIAGTPPRAPFQAMAHELMRLSISPSGRYLATSTSIWSFSVYDLRDWPASRDKPRQVYRLPTKGPAGWIGWVKLLTGSTSHIVNAFAIFENAPGRGTQPYSMLATAHQDGNIEVFELTRSHVLLSSEDAESTPAATLPPLESLAFNRSGSLIAAGAKNGRVLVWALPSTTAGWDQLDKTGRAPSAMTVATCVGAATAVAFSPDDRLMAVGCEDGSVHILNVTPRAPYETLETWKAAASNVEHLAFDPARRRLLTAGNNPDHRTIEEWWIGEPARFADRKAMRAELQRIAAAAPASSPSTLLDAAAALLPRLRQAQADLERERRGEVRDTWGAPR